MANLSSYLPGGIDPSAVTITGGTINGTAIGASTAAAGTFTTFTSTGIDDNATSTAITIDASENVGIGTASPATNLHLETSGNTGIQIRSGTTSYGNINFNDGATAKGQILYNHDGDYMRMYVNGSEAMRIDSSGDVGIGTASPSSTLHLYGTGTPIRLNIEATTGRVESRLDNTSGAFIFGIDDSGGAGFGSAYSRNIYSNGAYPMLFWTNNAERMRIDSSGNLLVGDTASIGLGVLEVTSPSAGRAHEFYKEETTITAVLGNWRSNVGSTQAVVARVLCDGDFENTNNSYTGISDVSLKENIVDASPQLDDIMAMRVRSYNLKSTGARHIGVIAQELEETSPELVKTGEDGLKSVKYSIMYMKAVKALQEAVTRIETLEAEVAALKGA